MIVQLLGNVPALRLLDIHEAFCQFALPLAPRPDLLEQLCIFDRAGSLICQPS
jgi:hypothetical protein